MPKPIDTNEKITLYRGVSANHVKYEDALKGIATPRGGHINANLHNAGDTNSIYTSWSTERWVAEGHALSDDAKCGVVLEKEFEISEIIPSPDEYDEWEMLIIGEVTDAEVYIITELETKPVFDSQSKKYKDGGNF